MRQTNLIVESKRYIPCPHCGAKDNCVDHLIKDSLISDSEKSFGPWYCDECGGKYCGKLKGYYVFIEKFDEFEKRTKLSVFLKHDDIMLIVEGSSYGEKEDENQEYLYNEHRCPHDILRDTQIVIDLKDDDCDPHGIFEYLGCVPHQDFYNVEFEEILKIVDGFEKKD